VLGNGLTPSTADVAICILQCQVLEGEDSNDVEKQISRQASKTGLLKKYCKKWITSVDCLMNVGEDTIVSSNIHCLYLWILSTRICHYIELLSLKACGEKIKPDDIRMWVEIAVYPYLRKLDVSYSSVRENMVPNSLFTCKTLVILKP
ncbi:hypothetical protein HID58_090072, partial [Brassica napus]